MLKTNAMHLYISICIIAILSVYIFLNREIYLTADELKEVLQRDTVVQGAHSKTHDNIQYLKYFNKDGSLVMVLMTSRPCNKKIGVSTGSYKIVNKGGAGYLLVTYNNISPVHPKTSRFHPDHKYTYAINTVIEHGPYQRVNSSIYSYKNDLGNTKIFSVIPHSILETTGNNWDQ